MIKWSSALSVGHAAIDAQHRELFQRLEALLNAMMTGNKSEVTRLFDFLGSYVVEHFGAEEKLMRDHGYPELQAHQAAHARFVADYTALKGTLDTGGGAAGAALTIKVQNWCGEWLKAHIAGTDQQLAAFLRSRAA